ncbi:MAG: S1 RNA-binding domain-containing protein [SAR202 cluster bacterium]|nr:S1 RNA-binding domain-containing protein [SAR202 cluster bacterium]
MKGYLVVSPQGDRSGSTMAELLQEIGGWKDLRRGEVVEGMIMSVAPDAILVNVGGKSEGVIPQSEMVSVSSAERAKLIVGAMVTAVVVETEGRRGPAVLSYDRARSEQGWKVLQEALDRSGIVMGSIIGTNKGGAVARVEGIEGFIPLSQLSPDTRQVVQVGEDASTAGLPRPVQVKILELERGRRRVVLSEKAAWLEQRAERKKEAIEQLKEGQTITGRVKSLTPFGAFVDIGGVEGLLHISEISWQPVRSPEEVLKMGGELTVVVLKVDREAGKVSLSLRQAQPHPWDTVAQKYEVGQIVKGMITKLAPFGAFVRIEPGVEGLIHISELSSKPITSPQQVVKEGEEHATKVLRIDTERRRLALSLRQAVEELGEMDDTDDTGSASPPLGGQ